MILTYKECIEKYKNHYSLMKALKCGEIYKISKGIYSTEKYVKDLSIFIKKYCYTIFTMESAFYYLGISDEIPSKYSISTNRDQTKYKDTDIKQYFFDSSILELGVITLDFNGVIIRVYNKERMLIELIRYKNKIPFDYYKEVIRYYRDHFDEINFSLVDEYLENFPKKNLILRTIQMEVL